MLEELEAGFLCCTTLMLSCLQELQGKVVMEQQEFLMYLENTARSFPHDYDYMHGEAMKFVQVPLHHRVVLRLGAGHEWPCVISRYHF